MMPIRVLFIEDDEESIRPTTIKLQEAGYIYKVTDFEDSKREINEFAPHIVSLDITATGEAGLQTPGNEIFEFIWAEMFRPIIVYSAHSDSFEGKTDNHPFVKKQNKSQTSDSEFLEKVQSFLPHVNSILKAEQNVLKAFSFSLRDVAPDAFRLFSTDPEKRDDIISRAGKRRLAASIDISSMDARAIEAWEQYLFPPVSEHMKLGDILQENGKPNEPDHYRIILTPSCDMVSIPGRRTPKVENILTARCMPVKDGFEKTSINDSLCIERDKLERKLCSDVLTKGYIDAIVPIPALEGKIPAMVANLRDLELIPFADVNNEGGKFIRIASIDSPFRELVAWAYLQVGNRPGVPDRDYKTWAKELVQNIKAPAPAKK